ncbi:hypothetical protein [Vacuolonema iberomarrocanum]|uniref:hypothetical protein n=1 Tax=Vacuolonema iberomarrocanum TaxID=3454632 RepID=UPI0019F1C58F|nr:hypothetical protein [filamentous cyanobacterium LEGE 07170]
MLVSTLKDYAQIFFQFTTPLIALVGLWRWRSELTGKVEYEVAKQSLLCAYSVRDRIQFVREGWGFTKENLPSKVENLGFEDSFRGFSKLTELLREELNKLNQTTIEAEIVFGKEVKERLDKLAILGRQLEIASLAYHTGYRGSWNSPERTKNQFFEMLVKADSVDEDKFQKDLNLAMDDITKCLRPTLMGKKILSRKRFLL